MTVLFAGGEDTSFSFIGSVSVTTTSTRFRAGFAREAINPTTNTLADPPANRAASPTFTAGNLLWVHGWFYDTSSSSSVLNVQGLIVRSPDGVSRILIRQTATLGILKVSSRNAAGTITDLATASGGFSPNTLTQLDLRIDYSSGGGIQMWIGGVQVINYTGDPRTDSATTLNQIELASFSNSVTDWSEVICADQDTRGMGLWTLVPQAAGNTQGWTPNTLANINENTINDGTFIATASNNVLSEWTCPSTAPGGTWNVLAIIQEARVLCGTVGPQHFDWIVRTAGTDYLAGSPESPTTNFGNFNQMWLTNPNTSAAWNLTDITTSGFNLGIESQA